MPGEFHDKLHNTYNLYVNDVTMASSSNAFVYMLRCADQTFYVGQTANLASREQTHNEGRGAAYTARRRPVRIVYAEEHASATSATTRERQLKRWSHEKKEALIRGDRVALDWLSHRSPKTVTALTWRDLLNRRS